MPSRTRCELKKVAWSSILVATLLLTVAVTVEGQQPKKVVRIGFLGGTASFSVIELKVFRERLRELAYIEGQNITIEPRYWEGKIEVLPNTVAELVGLKCDVIVTTGTEAVLAVKNATKTIPVVMGFSGDAVTLGIIADLARPGGNITGLTSINSELSGKRLELLKEVHPRLARVALLWNPGNPNTEYFLKETESAANALQVRIQSLEVLKPEEFEGVFHDAITRRAQGLILGGGGFLSAHRKRIVELAAKNRLAGIYPNFQYVDAGGLMAYAEDRTYMFRRAAEYVDKVLKGTKPADLPVERPKKFDLVINLNAAKQIGLTIPQSVLYRADKVIK
jgi:putative tryptophan/tyrosine transport system substrate-binding protein